MGCMLNHWCHCMWYMCAFFRLFSLLIVALLGSKQKKGSILFARTLFTLSSSSAHVHLTITMIQQVMRSCSHLIPICGIRVKTTQKDKLLTKQSILRWRNLKHHDRNKHLCAKIQGRILTVEMMEVFYKTWVRNYVYYKKWFWDPQGYGQRRIGKTLIDQEAKGWVYGKTIRLISYIKYSSYKGN